MANLYELTGQALQLQAMLEDEESDIQVILDTLESLNFDIEEKADAYAKIIKNITSDIKGLKVEETRLFNTRRAMEGRVEALKQNLEQSMIALDKKKFSTGLFSFNVQKNAPSLDISDDAKIPKVYYVKIDPVLDRKALLDAIKDGKTVKGVTLKQTESLRIK